MFNFIWPVCLIVFCNVMYNVSTKSVNSEVNPLASLVVTYLIAAAGSLILYLSVTENANLAKELGKLNWASFALGLAVIGLEAGYIYAYKAGWQVSSLPIVQAAVLAILLIFVGMLFFHEKFSVNKVIGIIFCLIGLVIINYKS